METQTNDKKSDSMLALVTAVLGENHTPEDLDKVRRGLVAPSEDLTGVLDRAYIRAQIKTVIRPRYQAQLRSQPQDQYATAY